MNRYSSPPRLLLSPEARDEAVEYLTTCKLPECAKTGWVGLSRHNEIVRNAVLGLIGSLDSTVCDNIDTATVAMQAGAGLTYFAFGFHETTQRTILRPPTYENSLPGLQRDGYIATFEASARSDENLYQLLHIPQSEHPALHIEPGSPLMIGAGCVRFLLNAQYTEDVIRSN